MDYYDITSMQNELDRIEHKLRIMNCILYSAISIMTCFIIFIIYRLVRQSLMPVETVNAKLVSKWIETYGTFTRGTGANQSQRCVLEFQFDDGEIKRFYVSPIEWAVILEENIGELSFRGNKYVGFYILQVSEKE
ncbi:MAG: DUF2500 family protein [Bacillota bacterium]